MRRLVPSITQALGAKDIRERQRYKKKERGQKMGYDSAAQYLKLLRIGTQVSVKNA